MGSKGLLLSPQATQEPASFLESPAMSSPLLVCLFQLEELAGQGGAYAFLGYPCGVQEWSP